MELCAEMKKLRKQLTERNIEWKDVEVHKGSGAHEAEGNCNKDAGDTVQATDRWTEALQKRKEAQNDKRAN